MLPYGRTLKGHQFVYRITLHDRSSLVAHPPSAASELPRGRRRMQHPPSILTAVPDDDNGRTIVPAYIRPGFRRSLCRSILRRRSLGRLNETAHSTPAPGTTAFKDQITILLRSEVVRDGNSATAMPAPHLLQYSFLGVGRDRAPEQLGLKTELFSAHGSFILRVVCLCSTLCGQVTLTCIRPVSTPAAHQPGLSQWFGHGRRHHA